MRLTHPYTLKILVISLFLSLHASFVWSMDEEDRSAYTHSHIASPAHGIKALYIDENALLTIKDKEMGKVWTYPAIEPDDKRYLRLLQESFVNYNPDSSATPNHLMVGIEALFVSSDTQEGRLHSWPLVQEGGIRDFCSAPPYLKDSHSLTINLAGEEKPQGVFIGSGKLLKKEGEKILPYYSVDLHPFPILTWINHKFIALTNAGYPHSEIEALNTLIRIDYAAFFKPILEKNNTLRALVFKFYSYNDICDSCQSAIQDFIPQFQSWLKKAFGKNERNIPVTAIGVANHCYGGSYYCKKEEEYCKICPISTVLKDTGKDTNVYLKKGINPYLKEGINWKGLEQSYYNNYQFPLLKHGEYKPFSGRIPALKQERNPALYIYIQQPTIEGLEKHIKPEFLEHF